MLKPTSAKYQAMFKRQLNKRQALEQKKQEKELEKKMEQIRGIVKVEEPETKFISLRHKERKEKDVLREPREIRWYIY